MTWRILICIVLGLLCPIITLADTLVVAGHAQELSSPLVVEGDEVLAPVLPALRLLGIHYVRTGSTLTLTSASDQTLQLTLGSKTVRADTRKVTLSAAPREVNGEAYLPMRALAPWFDAEARFDPLLHVLSLYPLVTATTTTPPADTAVLIRCAAPLQYVSGRLTDPPRHYFDFKHVALGVQEQQLPVASGPIQRLRLAQYSVSPSVVRLVVDLTENATITPVISEEGRLLTISATVVATPSPATPTVPPSAVVPALPAPAKLLGAVLTPKSSLLTELAVIGDGPLLVEDAYDSAKRELVLNFSNGLNTLPPEDLRIKSDKVVEKLTITGSATDPGVRLVITCKQDVGYLISRDATGIRVLLGTFSISDMTVTLDAGHGGHDSGAIGGNGTLEKDVNLDVVLRTAKLLANAGTRVLLTRSDDTFIPLDDRPTLANTRNADIFVSVHCNSSPVRNSCSGTQTYYRTQQSSALAATMHASLVRGTGFKNGGVRTANFLVIRKSLMPSILLEIGFLNNDGEEKKMNTPAFRQQIAEAIVNGIRRYAASKFWQLHRTDLSALIADTTTVAPPPAATTTP